MSHQMEETPGITQDKSFLNKICRKIVFIKMLCAPIFVLVYFYFCRTLYQFCIYGGVRKRGAILGICVLFFLVYLLLLIVLTSRMKILDSFPKNEATVKSYGFYKNYFYAFESKQILYLKECDEKNKDFLRLKYAKLPRYKAFFWKIPSIIALVLITIMTIIGVVKSAMHLNGKLAWFLFDLYHTPIVAEDITSQEELPEDDTEIDIPKEIFPESNAKKNTIITLELDNLNEADLPVFSENKEINQKYFDAIVALETKGILPDGKYAYNGKPEDFNRIKELAYSNKFAVYDYVGGSEDGKELIIKVGGTCMADSADYIFHYNKDQQSFECIYVGFYGGDFYNAGIIYTPFSHGDMYQDDFWPHDVYSYEQSSGTFQLIGSTGEIDLEIHPESEAEYQQYDLDGDKKVYYFSGDNETKYMNHDEFYQWESALLESGKIEMDWYECKRADLDEGTEATIPPTKEEVLAMRELVLTDMTEDERKRLTENIKVANQAMESAYVYDNIFEKLSDQNSLYWNYFDLKGDIQIGWSYAGTYSDMKKIMEDENISIDEFYKKYGEPEIKYNRFDADNFINLIQDMQTTVHNEALISDLQQLVDLTKLAAETHEMAYANDIYKILHDLDYFLLRYGIEDVGKYTSDAGMLEKYYGVLNVYADRVVESNIITSTSITKPMELY